jgi:uncharacterized protein YbcC (UPF0753/DUF2309 family)
MTKPRKRPQQSLDDRANYDAQRRTFEGASDIKTQPTSQEYRDGWDRIFGAKRLERAVAAQLAKHGQEYLDGSKARRSLARIDASTYEAWKGRA